MTEQSVQQHLVANVEGTLTAFSDPTICETCDVAKVRKLYKIRDLRAAQARARKHEKQTNGVTLHEAEAEKDADEATELGSVILGLMALRGS